MPSNPPIYVWGSTSCLHIYACLHLPTTLRFSLNTNQPINYFASSDLHHNDGRRGVMGLRRNMEIELWSIFFLLLLLLLLHRSSPQILVIPVAQMFMEASTSNASVCNTCTLGIESHPEASFNAIKAAKKHASQCKHRCSCHHRRRSKQFHLEQ